MSALHVAMLFAGAMKLIAAVMILRIGLAPDGRGGAFRGALALAGLMLLADAVMLVFGAAGAPEAVVLIWTLGVGVWSLALIAWLSLPRSEQSEANDGSRNQD